MLRVCFALTLAFCGLSANSFVLAPARAVPLRGARLNMGATSVAASAAVASFRSELPRLSAADFAMLRAGFEVKRQKHVGRQGGGYIVLDVNIAPATLFSMLSDLRRYPGVMAGVESVKVLERRPDGAAALEHAQVTLSRKMQLQVDIIQRALPEAGVIQFALAPKQPGTASLVDSADGFWLIESPADRAAQQDAAEWSRVWLSASTTVSPFIPQPVVDYMADMALPKATRWLKQLAMAGPQ